ncbi:ClpP crotonase [Coniophora puteana RWD-64-598 SS2]|uniref:Probable enoyl-CoA hydratase, mitochondrial n=1 Tax=Coniophora puteana (strain RWD-64-598) TaxID=741705 RepID=A0A5M3MTR8_CONPW|nr:ClpP crotonase [Coniophora puteana RWD-64-598 SS2]EIW82552.1 ClpP crotonase [Coniophora puteana RWD-64-598 SS2]
MASRSLLTSSILRHQSRTLVRGRSAFARFYSEQRYENILTSRPDPGVALITLNRPKALNALSTAHFRDILSALNDADADEKVGAIVLTGSEKAFAAGADILEMKDKTYADAYGNNFLSNWEDLKKIRKPIIAAVSGYALGGGCELALSCDIILASPTAKFGQPEINLGVIPGGGGTQRLTRAVGKARAMELMLTGRMFNAQEAERWGVVAKVVEEGEGKVLEEAVGMAKAIASKGRLAVMATKEAVNAAYEMPLTEGLRFERRLFHGLFATNDQKEGMAAFAEKRKPNFTDS